MSLGDMNETVAIIGGGVAGLSAAHELIKRGFKVHVYERRAYFGGKAASYRVSPPGARHATQDDPPGEHGFRFFPGWYRHLFATMAEIPYRRKETLYQGATVADNLVDVRINRLAWLNRPSVDLPLQIPRSATEAVTATQFFAAFRELGLAAGEVTLFFRKLLEVAAMPEAARVDRLEKISWWEFLECDDPARSQAYRDFIRATTRTMVAAKAEEASAYTIGRVAVRTFLDTLSSVDRVLNGPTNEVWIDPWVRHLRAEGVVFHEGMELDAIQFDAQRRRVKRLLVEPVVVADGRRLRGMIERWAAEPGQIDGDSFKDLMGLMADLSDEERVRNMPPGAVANLQPALRLAQERLAEAWAPLNEARQRLGDGAQVVRILAEAPRDERALLHDHLREARDLVVELASRFADAFASTQELVGQLVKLETHGRQQWRVDADYFVLALPLEQLAYHVNRSEMLKFLAPELRNVVPLSRHMDWMAGIQFYLTEYVSFSPGHLVGMDSPWALTAIESTQFWRDVALPPDVKSVISVDISAWDRRGLRTRKEAFNCTDDEIAEEVWAQLEEMLNRKVRPDVLRSQMLRGGSLVRDVSYHLDDSIVDLRDRKKQAFYEQARSVRFSALDLVQEAAAGDGTAGEVRYMWGPRSRFNAEPLLVNRPGSHPMRPAATTAVPNLFLAGDYVKTETDLASMEGANEAARRAVNGILAEVGSRKPPCELFPFSPGRQLVGAVATLGGAFRGIDGAASAVSELQNRFWKRLALGVIKTQGGRQLP